MKTIKISLVLAVLYLYSILATAVFAGTIADDSVLSQGIREADGTSGQSTNTGAGVKTGHIQDNAITTGKIADSAVTSGKVADGAVTTNKIIDGAVATGKIADGAVTDSKIMGPISASKIISTGLNADTVDGMHTSDLAPAVHSHSQTQVNGLEAALAVKSDVTHDHDGRYQQKYGKVAIVAQTGGDYAEPMVAMSELATWCGSPSATNTCLLKIMPGVYDIGSNSLQMQSYVDIEGSGENVTKIHATQSGAVLSGANNASLRFITVENENGGLYSCTISNYNSSPTMLHVTVISTNGIEFGIYNYRSSATLTNVTVKGAAWGIYSEFSSLTMINVTATADWLAVDEYRSSSKFYNLIATGGVAFSVFGYQQDAMPVIFNSQLTATSTPPDSVSISNHGGILTIHGSILKGSIFNYGSPQTITKIGVSQFDGQVLYQGVELNVKCFQVYDSNFDNVMCP